jgi:sigma-B regulation protein RsbU (phosphoserine phosphatase)
MSSDARRRALIAALVLPVAILLAWNQAYMFRFLRERTEMPKLPFRVQGPSAELNRLEDEATRAGLAEGDLLREVGTHPIRGDWDLAAALRGHRAGDVVAMTVERAGAPRTVDVALPPLRKDPAPLVAWIFDVTLLVVTPWVALLLGTFVVWLRPRDPLAWLLLGLMTGFLHMATGGLREGALELPRITSAIAYGIEVALSVSWSLFMLLFGLYFPDRDGSGALARWSRRILIPLILLLMITGGAAAGSRVLSFSALYPLERKIEGNQGLVFLLVSAAIAVFFVSISRKASTAGPDDRRRLKLLFWGAGVSTTPTACLVLYAIVTQTDVDTMPPWVFMPILLLLLGFPLTLAYVIVVQRAMDVRVVVREGLKYALAQRGVRVLQALVILGVVLTLVHLASDPSANLPQRYRAAGFGVLAVVLLQKLSGRAQTWIDQKFFREAVDAERILGGLNERVRTIAGREPLLQTVARSVSEALHVPKIAVLLARDGALEPAFAIGYDVSPVVSIPRDSELARRLAAGREPVDVFHDETDVRVKRDAALASARPQLKTLDSALLLPLTLRERLLGFLSLGPRMGDAPYTRNDKHLLSSVAAQTALALENNDLAEQVAHEVAQRERYLRDLEIAREVQERLYPQSPAMPDGIACAGHCRPARAVGGDYYDLFQVPGGRFGIAIGDISGKGIPAALLMASLQAYLRGLTLAEVPHPARLMENINRLVLDSTPDNRYATFFYGQYDPATRQLTYVNGGHTAPFLLRAAGTVERLDTGGPVVGLISPVRYEQKTLVLERGDLIVLYTDGLSEAMNHDDQEFGEERLLDAIRTNAGAPPTDLIVRLIAAADGFAAGAPQHDDMTVLVVRVG